MALASTVGDIMTRDVVVVHEEDNLITVASDLARYRFRHLPVVDGRRLVGVLSQTDLLRFTVSALEEPRVAAKIDADLKERTFVGKVMTQHPDTVSPSTSLADAAKKLVRGKFGCLPVVDAVGDLVGIVTTHNLLLVLAGLD